MKSSVGDLVFNRFFENVSIFTYTLDTVRKSTNLLHRVKTKLSNSAEIENSIYISTLLQVCQFWTIDIEFYQK